MRPWKTPATFGWVLPGDTFNTAWYLRQLRDDLQVSYLSAVGTDAISDRMLAVMADAGIGTDHVARRDDRSVGLYMISLSNGERSFSYWRDGAAARRLADDEDALTRAMDDADLVYFSGITLGILEPAARDRLMNALRQARANGKTIAFDPNLRPRLWPGVEAMTDAITKGAEVSDIVLPSYDDEAQYFGDANPEATADRYARAGATTVVVKNGPDPVHVLQDGSRYDVAVAPLTNIVDTTSAGDSFNAGFLADWGIDIPMDLRVTHAAAVAGQCVGGKGALVALDKAALPAIPA